MEDVDVEAGGHVLDAFTAPVLAMNPVDGSGLVAYVLLRTEGAATVKTAYVRGVGVDGKLQGVQQRIGLADSFDARNLRIVFGGNGDALAVWTQSRPSGGGTTLFSNLLRSGQWLGPSEMPVSAPASGFSKAIEQFDVLVDKSGNAVVSWSEKLQGQVGQPASHSLLAAVRSPGSAQWNARVVRGPSTSIKDFEPQLASLSEEEFVIASMQAAPSAPFSGGQLQAVRCTLQSSVCKTVPVPGLNTTVAGLDLAGNGAGLVAMTWTHSIGGAGLLERSAAFGSHLVSGGEWSPPLAFDLFEDQADGRPSAGTPTLAVTSKGKVFAAWSQKLEPLLSAPSNLYVREIVPGAASMDPPVLLEQGLGSVSGPTLLAADEDGNVLAVWGQRLPGTTPAESVSSGYASRYDATSRRFEAPSSIESSDVSVNNRGATLASDGRGLVMWTENQQIKLNRRRPAVSP